MKQRIVRLGRDNLALLIFIALMVCFRSALADWNTVPTGSMNPTIIAGDRILVNKMAYDIRVPLTGIFIRHLADPARGDIVTFESARADETLVKRAIGLPGDVVEMQHNRLIINGVAADYRLLQSDREHLELEERFPGFSHRIKVSSRLTEYGNFGPVKVPENMYLMLGDNRDNSADSRVYGFIPRGEIRGRSRMVVISLNYDNFFLPRSNRLLKDLM